MEVGGHEETNILLTRVSSTAFKSYSNFEAELSLIYCRVIHMMEMYNTGGVPIEIIT